MAVGLVVVSHSAALAHAVLELASLMVTDDNAPLVALAAGLPEGRFGTDATSIMTAIKKVRGEDGVAVFVDLGSAILSAETAIALLGTDDVRIVAAPLVEGLIAGIVRAALGDPLDEVVRAAEGAMHAKLAALGRRPATPSEIVTDELPCRDVQLINDIGLHARPAARLAALASKFDADIWARFEAKPPVNAKSTMSLMTLGAAKGDWLHLDADGPEAIAALDALVDFIASGLGDND